MSSNNLVFSSSPFAYNSIGFVPGDFTERRWFVQKIATKQICKGFTDFWEIVSTQTRQEIINGLNRGFFSFV